MSEEEEVEVDLKIKYKDQVRDMYDVPLDIKNSHLIGEVISMFFPLCELKLPDQKALTLMRPNFNLKRFMKRNKSEESFVRAVLKLDEKLSGSVKSQKTDNEDEKKVSVDLEELKKHLGLEVIEKKKVLKELEKARERIVELDSEVCILKKDLEKEKESSSTELLGLRNKFEEREGVWKRENETAASEIVALQKKLKQIQKEQKEKDFRMEKALDKMVLTQQYKWKKHTGTVKLSNDDATVCKDGNKGWNTIVVCELEEKVSYVKVKIEYNAGGAEPSGLVVDLTDSTRIRSFHYNGGVSVRYNSSFGCFPKTGDVIEFVVDVPNDWIGISLNGEKGTTMMRPSQFQKPMYVAGWMYDKGTQLSFL